MTRLVVADFITSEIHLIDGASRSVDEVMQDLDALKKLIERWQKVQNLVSRETPGDFWTRHVRDSLALLPHIDGATTLLDLGSGGGFPALPVSIALKDTAARYHLVESNGRKCAFLNAAKRELDLPIQVHNLRIEMMNPGIIPVPDIITARALAALKVLIPLIRPFLGSGTKVLLHKGREFQEELSELDSALRRYVLIHPQRGESDGVILEWPAGSLLS